MNAGARAVTGETARPRVIKAHLAITLRKNDSTVIDSKSTGIAIGQRRSAHGQDRERRNQEFHLWPHVTVRNTPRTARLANTMQIRNAGLPNLTLVGPRLQVFDLRAMSKISLSIIDAN